MRVFEKEPRSSRKGDTAAVEGNGDIFAAQGQDVFRAHERRTSGIDRYRIETRHKRVGPFRGKIGHRRRRHGDHAEVDIIESDAHGLTVDFFAGVFRAGVVRSTFAVNTVSVQIQEVRSVNANKSL